MDCEEIKRVKAIGTERAREKIRKSTWESPAMEKKKVWDKIWEKK